jgi:hypothetical protein
VANVAKNPLFSTYRTGENRVTASMIAVFERIDASVLERILAGACEESSLTLVRFANQVTDVAGTVPDAVISASFHYLFEVKTAPDALRRDQLKRHLAGLTGTAKDERLFVITPDPERPRTVDELEGKPLSWFNFARLNQAITVLLDDPTELISEQSRFLLRELQALFEHEGLLVRADTVVVAARVAYPEYKQHAAYVCQAGRAFRGGLQRMGFYANGAIQQEVPRILERMDKVTFSDDEAARLHRSEKPTHRAIADLIDTLLAEGRRARGETYQVFLLSRSDDERTLRLAKPIVNTTRDSKGQPWAWTLGQRYTRSEVLERGPGTTEELTKAGG